MILVLHVTNLFFSVLLWDAYSAESATGCSYVHIIYPLIRCLYMYCSSSSVAKPCIHGEISTTGAPVLHADGIVRTTAVLGAALTIFDIHPSIQPYRKVNGYLFLHPGPHAIISIVQSLPLFVFFFFSPFLICCFPPNLFLACSTNGLSSQDESPRWKRWKTRSLPNLPIY